MGGGMKTQFLRAQQGLIPPPPAEKNRFTRNYVDSPFKNTVNNYIFTGLKKSL